MALSERVDAATALATGMGSDSGLGARASLRQSSKPPSLAGRPGVSGEESSSQARRRAEHGTASVGASPRNSTREAGGESIAGRWVEPSSAAQNAASLFAR